MEALAINSSGNLNNQLTNCIEIRSTEVVWLKSTGTRTSSTELQAIRRRCLLSVSVAQHLAD